MMTAGSTKTRTIGCGAGFAGDRIDPAVALAASGRADAIVLECLAERTLVPGLRSRAADPTAGADPRLRRRLKPLLPAARANDCRVISNLGAANPASAVRQIAELANEVGCGGLEVAGLVGDDVLALKDRIDWRTPIAGRLLGAHAYLGCAGIVEALAHGADVVVTGRTADSALFSAEAVPILANHPGALAGATTVGHLLECSGQITGGNFNPLGEAALSAADYADLGYPLATVDSDGSAEIFLLDGKPGVIDVLTCTLQLLYEVHDPSAYVTPDVIIDYTGIEFKQVGPNRVRVSGAKARGRPDRLKVSGFVELPGFIADVEIGYAGVGAHRRGRVAAEALRIRLSDIPEDDIRIDLVGVDSILGAASPSAGAPPAEVRVHVSARCADAEMAQIVEDEVYALTLSGPAGACSVRSERRPRLDVVDGFIDRALVATELVWERAA
jgi:Acyclic terpene utilisation family protein AtuA